MKYKEYVTCPICGKQYKRLYVHILKTHHISISDFKKEYPDSPLDSELSLHKMSEKSLSMWNDEQRRSYTIQRMYEGNASEETKKKRSKNSLKNWSDNRNYLIQRMKEGNSSDIVRKHRSDAIKSLWEDFEYRERHTESIRKTASTKEYREKVSSSLKEFYRNKDNYAKWLSSVQTDEYKEKQRVHSLEMWSDPNHIHKVHAGYTKNSKFVDYKGKLFYLRSSYECICFDYLVYLGYDFDYECSSFEYFYKGYLRHYVPDFYLKDFHLFLEVKPLKFTTNHKIQAKLNSVREKGYSIIFITENELKDLDIFKDTILGSTTIQTLLDGQ